MTHDNDFRDADGLVIRHGADVPAPAMPDPFRDPTMVELSAAIIAAYVANNHVALPDLPDLIRSVYDALAGLGRPFSIEIPAEPPKPAVSIKKSVTDDYIVCLEDGRKFKSLKRHLAQLGMTPAEYRAKWGLPHDYPMVAPAYAAKRSALAKEIGLGRKIREAAE